MTTPFDIVVYFFFHAYYINSQGRVLSRRLDCRFVLLVKHFSTHTVVGLSQGVSYAHVPASLRHLTQPSPVQSIGASALTNILIFAFKLDQIMKTFRLLSK